MRKIISLATCLALLLTLAAAVGSAEATAGTCVAFNDMSDDTQLFWPGGTVTVSHETIGGEGFSRLSSDPAITSGDNAVGVPIVGSPDLSGTDYFYLRIKTPENNELYNYWEIVGGGAWCSPNEGAAYSILDLGDLESGWVPQTCQWKYFVFPAGFDGWVKMSLDHFAQPDGGIRSWTGFVQLTPRFNYIGSGTESVLVGGIYAAGDDSAVPNLPDLTPPAASAAEIRDFEQYEAAGVDLINANTGECFWGAVNADGLKIVTSAKNAASGTYSAEISPEDSADRQNYLGAIFKGTYQNKAAVAGKRYVAFHVTAPPASVEYKNPQHTDQYGNPIFAVAFVLRVIDGQGGHYYVNQGGWFLNKARLLKDGGSELADALTLEQFILLPFGFSGWLFYDTQNFACTSNADPFTFDNPDNYWEIAFSQVGNKAGPVYFDAMYAYNDMDEEPIPGLTLTADGDNNIGYFDRYIDPDEDKEPGPVVTDPPGTGSEEEEEENKIPPTGDRQQAVMLFAALSAAGVMLTGMRSRKRKPGQE